MRRFSNHSGTAVHENAARAVEVEDSWTVRASPSWPATVVPVPAPTTLAKAKR